MGWRPGQGAVLGGRGPGCQAPPRDPGKQIPEVTQQEDKTGDSNWGAGQGRAESSRRESMREGRVDHSRNSDLKGSEDMGSNWIQELGFLIKMEVLKNNNKKNKMELFHLCMLVGKVCKRGMR